MEMIQACISKSEKMNRMEISSYELEVVEEVKTKEKMVIREKVRSKSKVFEIDI